MPQADRDFLAEYVRAQPSRQKDETLDAYLRRVGVDEGEPTNKKTEPPATPAQVDANHNRVNRFNSQQERANQRNQRDQARQVGEAKRAAEEEARARQARNASLIGKGLQAAGIAPNKAADTVERWRDRIANLPTPTGTGGMLVLLLIFIAFIIPVAANYTRAQLFWLTLLGRTQLTDSQGSEPARPSVSQGSEATPPPSSQGGESSVRPVPITLPMPGGPGGPQLPS